MIWYRITKALGSGQFGVVSMGVWQSPMGAVEVAVKQLQPGATEAEKIRFLQEAAINRQFRHPNVVQLMGVVTTGEQVSLILYRITAAGVLFQCMACCENNCRIWWQIVNNLFFVYASLIHTKCMHNVMILCTRPGRDHLAILRSLVIIFLGRNIAYFERYFEWIMTSHELLIIT